MATKTTKMSKRELVQYIAEYAEVTVAQAKLMLEGLGEAMIDAVSKKGPGEFALSGLLKITTKTRPAIKKGTKTRNPFTGETVPHKGRPASKVVKIRPLAALKQAAN